MQNNYIELLRFIDSSNIQKLNREGLSHLQRLTNSIHKSKDVKLIYLYKLKYPLFREMVKPNVKFLVNDEFYRTSIPNTERKTYIRNLKETDWHELEIKEISKIINSSHINKQNENKILSLFSEIGLEAFKKKYLNESGNFITEIERIKTEIATILVLVRVKRIQNKGKHIIDNAMLHDEAMLYDEALMFGNASAYGDSQVFENATVCEYGKIMGSGIVKGYAVVCGNSVVTGKVEGNAILHSDNNFNYAWAYTSGTWHNGEKISERNPAKEDIISFNIIKEGGEAKISS